MHHPFSPAFILIPTQGQRKQSTRLQQEELCGANHTQPCRAQDEESGVCVSSHSYLPLPGCQSVLIVLELEGAKSILPQWKRKRGSFHSSQTRRRLFPFPFLGLLGATLFEDPCLHTLVSHISSLLGLLMFSISCTYYLVIRTVSFSDQVPTFHCLGLPGSLFQRPKVCYLLID